MRQVLWFFNKYQEADGSLKNLPYWNFTDWCETKGWQNGMAPFGKDGFSAALDLQLLWAYQLAAELEDKLGMTEYAKQYEASAAQLKGTIQKKYWDNSKKLFADTDEKDVFSQHTNSLAILTGLMNDADATALAKKLLSDDDLTQATIYFKYYLHQALVKAGLGDGYMDWLGIWRKNIEWGLTTWTEDSNIEFTRSDCHAWGSSPNIEFFRTVLGIDSDAPGFRKVRVEPHLGKLTHAGGTIPHPNGKISVSYRLHQGKWSMDINLPVGISGTFVWKGKVYELKSGGNKLTI